MKTITTTLLIIGLFFSASSLKGQSGPQTLSLDEVVKLALENNHAIEIADLEKQKAVFQRKESLGGLLPKAQGFSTFSYYYAIPKMVIPGEIFGKTGNIPVEFGTKYDWNSGIKFSQFIYNQSYLTSLDLLNEFIDLKKLNLELQREEVVFQVSRLFYLCLSVRKQLIAFDSTLANMDTLKDIVVLQQENDFARQADVNRVAIDIRKLEIEELRLEEHLHQQLNLLKLLSGLPAETEVVLEDEAPHDLRSGALLKTGKTHWLELQMLERQMKITELQIKMERQSYLPELYAFGQHYYQGMRDRFDFFDGGEGRFFKSGIVGLQLNVPLFDGFSKRHRIHLKQLELAQTRLQREQTRIRQQSERKEAWQNYRNSLEALEKQTHNVEAARKIYQTNLQGYREQVVNLTDLILSENQLTESFMNYYKAEFELKNAELMLSKMNGSILENLK